MSIFWSPSSPARPAPLGGMLDFFAGGLFTGLVEIAAGSVRYNLIDLFDMIAFSVDFHFSRKEAFKGHRPKDTVEVMLASTFPLVGQR